MATITRTWRRTGLDADPLEVPLPESLDEGLGEDEDRRRRPWVQLLIALLVAVLAVYFAGQTAARLWLEDLDERLVDAGAGTNAELTMLERSHLAGYRAITYAQGFAPALARYDSIDIEKRLAPVDANHGIPMIDIVDSQNRVVFAFRAEGAVRPMYRDRRGVAIVEQVLAGRNDRYGDRFSAVLTTQEGPLIATAGPIRLDGKVIGAVLLMTPVDELLSRSANLHGSRLSTYSLDRGDPMATTTPNRPRTLGTALRTELAQPERLPYSNRFRIGGVVQREQIGGLVLRHQTAAFVGASLPDRSREVALRVMLIAGSGMAIMAFLVWVVGYAWAKDRYERGNVVVLPDEEPLALPEVSGTRR